MQSSGSLALRRWTRPSASISRTCASAAPPPVRPPRRHLPRRRHRLMRPHRALCPPLLTAPRVRARALGYRAGALTARALDAAPSSSKPFQPPRPAQGASTLAPPPSAARAKPAAERAAKPTAVAAPPPQQQQQSFTPTKPVAMEAPKPKPPQSPAPPASTPPAPTPQHSQAAHEEPPKTTTSPPPKDVAAQWPLLAQLPPSFLLHDLLQRVSRRP